MKTYIEQIIKDLGESAPIQQILLKAQIVASKLDNQDFREWIQNEQNGYPDASTIPEYRILNALVKADIFQPYIGIYKNYNIPEGIFDSEVINDSLFHIRLTISLSEIENLCAGKKEGSLFVNCPAIAYTAVNKYVNGNAQRVWQEFSVFSCLDVVNVFKSKLLAFFLDLDKKIDEGIDFGKIQGQQVINQIMTTYNISSVVANVGEGTVNTGAIVDNVSVQNITNESDKEQIRKIIEELSNESKKIDNDDLQDIIMSLKAESEKPTMIKKTLRCLFNAVKGIATSVVANQLTPIVDKALALLH